MAIGEVMPETAMCEGDGQEQKSKVEQSFSGMTRALNNLEESVSFIRRKADPALVPVPPAKTEGPDDAKNLPVPEQSPLVEQMMEIERRIYRCVSDLMDIHDRLQL